MATSVSMSNSAPLEGELLPQHSQLLVEITDLLVVILGDYSTKKLQVGSRDRPTLVHNERLIASLTEISAMWDYCDQPTRVVIADSIVDVEQLLELFYDILYKACRDFMQVHKVFEESAFLVVKLLCKWVCISRKMQLKILGSGLLYGSLSSVQCLFPHLQEENEMAKKLVIYNLRLLHICLMESVFRIVYTYSGNDWFTFLLPLTQSIDSEVRLYSKFVACHVIESFSHDHLSSLLKLDKADIDILITTMLLSTTIKSDNLTGLSLSSKDVINTITAFIEHGDDQFELWKKVPFDLILSNMLASNDEANRIAVCKLLVDAQLSPRLKEVLKLPQTLFSEFESADMWMQDLLKVYWDPDGLSFNILSLSGHLISAINDLDVNHPACERLISGMLDILLKLSGDDNYLSIAEYLSHELIQAMYHLVSTTFDAVDTVNEELLSCIPVIFLCILRWTYGLSDVQCIILDCGLLAEHPRQLMELGNMGYLLFRDLLVTLNLGIILNCVQHNHLSVNTKDVNWPLVLKPWLESDQRNRLMAFLICGCVAHFFKDDDPAYLELTRSDTNLLIQYFTTASESAQLFVKLDNGLVRLSALVFVRSLCNLYRELKVLPQPEEMFRLTSNLLFTGNNPEKKAACLFISLIDESKGMIDNSELPLLEVLEQLQEDNDPELKLVAKDALSTIHREVSWDESSLLKHKYQKLLEDAEERIKSCLKCMAVNQSPDYQIVITTLLEVRLIYTKFNSETQLELSELSIGSIQVICTFICKLLEGEVNSIQLQCLACMLSIMSSWSDKNNRVRYRILRTQLLWYLIEFVNLLASITDSSVSDSSIENALHVAVINISNCSQEKDFGILYTPPGKINWCLILESWMNSTNVNLRFSAKLIAGHLSHVLEYDQLYLLHLSSDDLTSFVKVFCDSVKSEVLVGTGFSCQFSAEELSYSLRNFLLNESNFSSISAAVEIPMSILTLFIKGGISIKQECCRILLYLLNSSDFKELFKTLNGVNTLFDSSSGDPPTLKFLKQCVNLSLQQNQGNYRSAIIHFEPSRIIEVIKLYEEMLMWVASEMSKVLIKYEGRTIKLSNKGHTELIAAVEELYRFWRNCTYTIQAAILQNLTVHKVKELIVMNKFIMEVESALNKHEEEVIGPCYVTLLLCICDWIRTSNDFCKFFLKSGLILKYVKFEINPPRTKDTTFANFVVSAKLTILHQCIQMKGSELYYHKIMWYKFLSNWVTCPHQEIRVLSRLIAGYVISSFDDQMLSLLHFDEDDATILVDLLRRRAYSEHSYIKRPDMFFAHQISSVLRSINTLLNSQDCRSTKTHLYNLQATLVDDDQLVPSLMKIVSHGSQDEKLQACYLLWNLMEHDKIRKEVANYDEIDTLLQGVCKLSEDSSPELKIICERILHNSPCKDVKDVHLDAKCCFLQGKYRTCIELCDKILLYKDVEESLIGIIKYLKGKACYRYFNFEQYRLSLDTLTEDVKTKIFNECYSMNTMAIELLAEAIDSGCVHSDEKSEASYMLDRAMMECIYKANLLNNVHRCYMCRRKLNPGENLIKSHVIPRAVLEIMSVKDVGNKQVFFAPHSSMKHAKDRLITPAEMAYYMLCSICEEAVSKHGEIQFPEIIFRKLYANIGSEQTIEYGPWLYEFCVSLLFRALHWDLNAYVNDQQVYEVFKNCHEYVRSWLKSPVECKLLTKPKVYIFISPVSGGREDLHCGYFNWFLRGGLSKCFGNVPFNGISVPELKLHAHYFVIQMNLMNIVVRIFNDSSEDIFENFIINPEGGRLWIPPEHQRKASIPKGIWLKFQKLALTVKKDVNKFEHVISRSIKGSQLKELGSASNCDVGKGMVSDANVVVKHEAFRYHHSSMMLPPQFTIKSEGNRKLNLPPDHKILLHSNYVRGPGKGSTFFIAVGTSRKYSVDKPYVLWYFYEPFSEVSCGAFFSIDSYEITSFLASDNRIDMKAMANSSLMTARMRMPKIIKDLLEEKGFSSMHSLLDRVKSAIRVGREPPPMDMKCEKERKCWYCKALCQNCCSKLASYGRISNTPHGPVVFCSDACQILSPGMFTSPQVFVISSMESPPSDIHIHCAPISPSHLEIQHIYIRALNKRQFPCEREIAICVGDGGSFPCNKPYVVFYSHHLFHQLFVEFFINSDLLAVEPLPHTANESSWDAILQLNEAAAVKKILEQSNLEDIAIVQLAQIMSNTVHNDSRDVNSEEIFTGNLVE